MTGGERPGSGGRAASPASLIAAVLIITASLIPHRQSPPLSPRPFPSHHQPVALLPFIPQPFIHHPLSLPSPEAPLHPSVSSPSLPVSEQAGLN
ncbi:hypothetical protein E2C01_035119 [Portunus trituberculatus]|uniref:Uncharacterized protein n=1 Tax=Portunus trituberculatus TaxID=210409 RepID=A0A5B7F8V9_PORTR|nr:hypothetical protein [Portunus trituberculatus]